MNDRPSRTWLKNPMAVFTANDLDASGGVVVEGPKIVELVEAGAEPELRCDETFDASRHVVTPGRRAALLGKHDPLSALLLCGADRADQVMVGGAWRVADGEIVGLDTERLIAQHSAAARRLVGS